MLQSLGYFSPGDPSGPLLLGDSVHPQSEEPSCAFDALLSYLVNILHQQALQAKLLGLQIILFGL